MSSDDRPGYDRSDYDPLSAPLPSELAAEAARREAADRVETTRSEVIPRSRPEPPRGRGRRRVPTRRLKRTLRHVDPVSILKLSLFFYVCFLVIWLIVVAIIYSLLSSMGLFDTIEELAEAFAVEWDSQITLFFVERWAFLIGLTFAVVGSLVNVFIAFLYNVAADTVGGVEMTFIERDL
jgi:hypothetical protein